ncbi:MAG: tRNA(fMet)-specific endonuclease VapC [Verrucomicrobiales bacterium]|jgi:tRNA(fMet)-specific endonuclease VapC
MRYLIDTSIYAQPLRKNPLQQVLERWQQVGFDATAVSIVTEAEVLSGLYLHGGERRFHYYQNSLRDRVQILNVDPPVARLYARLKARQTRMNLPLPENDLFVAATAKAHGLTVATLNRKSFEQIEGLTWEDWSR